MRLLLTSSGLANEKIRNFFVFQFDRLDNKTAALITSARTEEEQNYINESRKELDDLKVKVTEINISKEDIYENYPEFDIYYVCGGNTYYILGRMRFTGMDKILVNAVKKNKFYVGVSAGSILAGPDIEAAGWGKDGDVNDVNLYNPGSFNLVPFLIFPHFPVGSTPSSTGASASKHELSLQGAKQEVINFKKYRFQEPVIALTDNQALYATDLENILIGGKGGLQFCEKHKLKDHTS